MKIKITNKQNTLFNHIYDVVKENDSTYLIKLDIGGHVNILKEDCEIVKEEQ